jgi:hypothetical protein
VKIQKPTIHDEICEMISLKHHYNEMTIRLCRLLPVLAGITIVATIGNAGELTTHHKKELTVFGMRALGLNIGVADIKCALTGRDRAYGGHRY